MTPPSFPISSTPTSSLLSLLPSLLSPPHSIQVIAVLGIVFAIIIYSSAVSAGMHRIMKNIPGGPGISDLVVSITGAIIQLIAIEVMNLVYERLAYWFTSWGETKTKLKNHLPSKLAYRACFEGKFS